MGNSRFGPQRKTPPRKEHGYVASAEMVKYKAMRDVGERYCRGVPIYHICKELGATPEEVGAALLALKSLWLDSALQNFNARRSEELAKIDHMESRCWLEFDKSCENEVTMVAGQDKVLRAIQDKAEQGKRRGEAMTDRPKKPKLTVVKVTTRKTSKRGVGHPAFLELVKWCIEARIKLLNLGEVPGDAAKPTLDWDALFKARPPKFVDAADDRILQIGAGKPAG